MKPLSPKRNIAVILLISLLLQSCGLSQPLELHLSQGTAAQPQPTYAAQQSVHQPPTAGPSTAIAITNVSDLIRSCNQPSPSSTDASTQWLNAYVACFRSLDLTQGTEAELKSHLEEYKHLVHIKTTAQTRGPLRDYWQSMFAKLSSSSEVTGRQEVPFMSMLAYVLQHIDPSLFLQQDVQFLVDTLSNHLLIKVDPSKKIFTAGTYTTHAPTLESIYHIFRIIQTLDPSKWTSHHSTGPYQRIRHQLDQIASSTDHYPILYHAHLLTQSLAQYEQDKEDPNNLTEALQGIHAAWKGAVGLYGAWQGFTNDLVSFNIEKLDITQLTAENVLAYLSPLTDSLGSLKEAYGHFTTVLGTLTPNQKPYYAYHQSLYIPSILSLASSEQYDSFMACVAEVEKACIKSKLTPVDKKALRYCILRQLGMLSLHAQDNAVRVKSLDKLQELGQSWSGNRDIEEELKLMLLDGLGTISQQSAHNADKTRAKNILESWLTPLESVSTPYTPKVPLSTLDMSDFDLTGGTSSREAGAVLNVISTLPSASQLGRVPCRF
ncbi:MAG: hypothetical protein AAF706_03220 [Bacteroidota bacterium]